ncbi:glycosyltransferase family 1 protein [Cryobacterium sp. TMS1-20-1]|uniref:glycosyltransferase family 4 protein n=1 Tax=unclassified Cryobacterium TaxID=2649013 RepID=UPI00106AACF0|nr:MULTISPECIES: glycosyltransferase family 1 protein [unclassified Cryobacterium]TFC72417.1 glycosyltransferase family 1 protein [Cryobacterium sp. TMS1-20-1]TFD55471.1 glycosyltransferase family 1 protein [Cryobacterium sp. Hh7]
MTTLRVIVEQMLSPVPGGIGRYTEEITRQLIATAPDDCSVEGVVCASTPEKYASVLERLPGLASLFKTTLPRRELAAAWQLGLTSLPGGGMVHAPSLLAPLRRHDRATDQNQVAVTIHDVVPWTHPETLTPHGVTWHKAMAKRARKHADAIIVPTHAVARALSEIIDFGDRIRVIGGAVSSELRLPLNADERAAELQLPSEFILTVGTLEPRKGLTALITGLGLPGAPDLPLLIVGPQGWGELDVAAVADEAGLAEGRVRALGFVSDSDLALILSRASVFVYPSQAEGFGLPLLEAMSFGTPVVHSDAPALVEVAGEAGQIVALNDAAGYPERLAAAVARAVNDRELRAALRLRGLDRAKAYSWRDSAERVWQLHADL